jgi:hypothetical protein
VRCGFASTPSATAPSISESPSASCAHAASSITRPDPPPWRGHALQLGGEDRYTVWSVDHTRKAIDAAWSTPAGEAPTAQGQPG